jgi:glycosyltransferase involved in cell wall biosynthesis
VQIPGKIILQLVMGPNIMLLSVIVTTYNWPQALNLVLQALQAQTDTNFEIIIADDGSGSATKKLITTAQATSKVPIQHVWQEDLGFRAARCRNQAILHAKGEYIIFLDGDCVVLPDFVANHRTLAEAGYFVAGNRVLLSPAYTDLVVTQQLPIFRFSLSKLWACWRKNYLNRFLPLISLPWWPRKLHPNKWQGAKGCNLAAFKTDLLSVNGWDESFTGWGYEDSDLVVRLINSGVKRKEGRFKVPVLHLWHKENPRDSERQNFSLLQDIIASHRINAILGLTAHQHHNPVAANRSMV